MGDVFRKVTRCWDTPHHLAGSTAVVKDSLTKAQAPV